MADASGCLRLELRVHRHEFVIVDSARNIYLIHYCFQCLRSKSARYQDEPVMYDLLSAATDNVVSL